MEFFAEVTNRKGVTAEGLYELLTIARLPEFCASIDKVISLQSSTKGEIYSVWGQFTVSREKIRNGVRFALLNCPHAVAWTVSVHEQPGVVMIHCTIDKKDEEREFIESIEKFVAEWADGLTGVLT